MAVGWVGGGWVGGWVGGGWVAGRCVCVECVCVCVWGGRGTVRQFGLLHILVRPTIHNKLVDDR